MTITLKNLFIGSLTAADVAVYTPTTAACNGKILSASAYNSDSVDRTIDVYIVPTGGAGGAAVGNQIYNDKVIPAGQSIDLDLLRGKNIIGAGSLVAKASSANVVTLAVSGLETS